MVDLFESQKPKREQLLSYIKSKVYCRTSDIIKWGVSNFSNRAERDARQLAEEGRIKRMDEKEKLWRGFKGKESVWIYENKTA